MISVVALRRLIFSSVVSIWDLPQLLSDVRLPQLRLEHSLWILNFPEGNTFSAEQEFQQWCPRHL